MVDDPDVAFGNLLQLGQFHELVGAVRLGDVAGAANDRVVAGCGEQRCLGPEIDRVADRDAEFLGQVACRQSFFLGLRDIPGRKRRPAKGFDELGLAIGNAVDFWTEASLFSAAGYNAFVCGPGDIAQAHSADEFVELSQLQLITESYIRIIDHAGA